MSDVYEVRRVMEKQAFIRLSAQRDAAFRTEMVYERCSNHLLLDVSQENTQKIQLGFAVCRPTHTPNSAYAENRKVLKLAIRDDRSAMLEELDAHLLQGWAAFRKTAART